MQDAQPHINTCFKYLLYFSREYHLIDDNDLKPMAEIVKGLEI